jgi:hypothetical protein
MPMLLAIFYIVTIDFMLLGLCAATKKISIRALNFRADHLA